MSTPWANFTPLARSIFAVAGCPDKTSPPHHDDGSRKISHKPTRPHGGNSLRQLDRNASICSPRCRDTPFDRILARVLHLRDHRQVGLPRRRLLFLPVWVRNAVGLDSRHDGTEVPQPAFCSDLSPSRGNSVCIPHSVVDHSESTCRVCRPSPIRPVQPARHPVLVLQRLDNSAILEWCYLESRL